MKFFTRKEATAILLFGSVMGVVAIADGRTWMRTCGQIELVCITAIALILIWWGTTDDHWRL